MNGLADRLYRLAGDAARLAQELSAHADLVQQMVMAFSRARVAVTHGAHPLFREEVGLRFAGAEPFDPESLLVRSDGRQIELDYREPIAWLALHRGIAADRDVLLGLDFEMEPGATLGVFVRSQVPKGGYVDGPMSVIGGGAQAIHRLLPYPEPASPDAASSVFLVFNGLTGPVTLRSFAATEIARG